MILEDHNRQRLADTVYDTFYEAIISGNIKQGEWLRQTSLAEKMKVSQSTIREALGRLVAEGLAEQIARKGVQVAYINENDLSDIYELRILAEGLAWESATSYITAQEIKSMRELLSPAEDEKNNSIVRNLRKANQTFHMIPIYASKRRYLIKTLSGLINLNNYFHLLQEKPLEVQIQDREVNRAEHEELINALEAGDGKLTRNLIEKHIRRSLSSRLDLYSSKKNKNGE